MSPLLRRVLFLAFLGGFLVAAPVTVLYTAGYRWNPGVARLVPTGLLSVESVPAGAHVRIDGNIRGGVTPALQKNVLPGLHAVEVRKNGYLTWTKTLSFASRETTFAQVLLFADTVPTRLWTADPTATAIDPHHGRVATARTQGAWTEFWTLEVGTGEERLVARLPSGTGLAPEWSGDGSALRARGTKLPFFGDAQAFDPGAGFTLAAAGDRVSLARLRPPEPPELIASLPAGSYAFRAAPDGLLLLEDAARHRIAVVSPTADHPLLLSAPAERWSWEQNGRRLLYSDGYDIHVFRPDTLEDDTLTRLSEPLTGLAWHPSGLGVVYSQDARVAYLELADQGGRLRTTLAEGTGLRDAWVDARGRTLYFLGSVSKQTGLFERLLVQ